MKTIRDLCRIEIERDALILCTGASIIDSTEQIHGFVRRTNPFVIGVNNVTNFLIPDYHLWTNWKRLKTFGKNINIKSKLLLGSGIPFEYIKEVIGLRDYFLIDYIEKEDGVFKETMPIKYKEGKIYGFYRTAGCLAIMVAHIMGASQVNIVGMDGLTFHKRKDVFFGKKSQRYYDKGYTTPGGFDWEYCVKIDKIVKRVLHNLREYGVNFRILTPTMHKNFYDGTVLGG